MVQTNKYYTLNEPARAQHAQIWQKISYLPQKSLTLCIPPNTRAQKEPHFPLLLFAADPQTKKNRLSALLQFCSKGYAVAVLDSFAPETPFLTRVKDFQSAARFLMLHAWQYHLDSHRIIAGGEGTGAGIAALATASQSDQDINSEDVFTLPVRLRGCLALAGDFTYDQQFHFPEAVGKKSLPPFLLIHGSDDQTVPFSESAELYAFLTQADQQATMYQLENCPHGSDAYFTPYLCDIMTEFLAECCKKKNKS